MPKTLLLMRHAKSSWSDQSLADIDRPLNQRGRLAGALMGQFLIERAFKPDHVLLSPAVRVQQTWGQVKRFLPNLDGNTVTHDAIYAASPESLLNVLRAVPHACETVLLVAHEPSLSELTDMLSGKMPAKFPSGAIAELSLLDTWRELKPGTCKLASFTCPKELV